MKIKFKNDIKDLLPKGEKISLNSIKIPMNREVYFRSKQWELIEQYGGARRFLLEIYTDDWKHWFEKSKDPFDQDYFEWVHKSYFLEIATMYYNIVVDLSWTLCYVVAEYAVKCNGKMVDFTGIMPIEEAYDLLRNAENNSKAPTSKDNPFEYLKKNEPRVFKSNRYYS